MSPQNLTNVYNQNPTLQGQYTLQQYLDLFGGTPLPATTQPVPTPTPTPAPVQPGIINQNINQYQGGGDGNGNFTGGKFGDLDLSTTKTEYRDVSDGKGGSTIKAFETAMNKGGLRKDIETGLNVTHGGLNVEPIAISIANALIGKEKYKGEYPEAGKTLGTFSNRKGTNDYGVPFADLNIFQKIKMDMSRNKELKQYAAELQKQKELKEQIERDAQIQRAINRQPPKDSGDRGRDDTPGFGKTTQGNYTNQFQGGDPGLMADGGLMGRGGSRRRSYFNGGIAGFKNGGRINFRGGGSYQGGRSSSSSSSSKSSGPAGGASAGGNYGGNRNKSQTYGGSIFRGGGGGPKPGSGRVNIPNRSGPKNLSFFDKINIHSANNAKLEKAYRDKVIDSDEYNVLGGLSSKRDLGFGPVRTAAASTAYNLLQSALGPKFSRGNQSLFDGASDIGRNTFGSTLDPNSALAQTYDTIMNTYKRGGRVNYFNGGIVSLRRR